MPENINIDKTVFNKNQFELAVDTKFSELFAQNTPLTVDQFLFIMMICFSIFLMVGLNHIKN